MRYLSEEQLEDLRDAAKCWHEAAKKVSDALNEKSLFLLNEIQPLFDETDRAKQKYEEVKKKIREE